MGVNLSESTIFGKYNKLEMAKKSAGILMYRFLEEKLEIFLVHPGGPIWKNKDQGAWSIPKGEFEDEDPLQAAKREFFEETGMSVEGEFKALTPVTQKNGKRVYAWATEGNVDPEKIKSNEFEMEWPPKSGRRAKFPEIDKAGWFPADVALRKINSGQAAIIRELAQILGVS